MKKTLVLLAIYLQIYHLNTHQPALSVDALLEKTSSWKAELTALRAILKSTRLVESVKWYQPCYSYNGENVVIIGKFKKHCVLGFFKGVLINDTQQVLHFAGPNTQSSKIMKFTTIAEINAAEATIIAYVNQAIAIVENGLKPQFKQPNDWPIPAVLVQLWLTDLPFKTAFYALTPGRQRAYLMHFNNTKSPSTALARINKAREAIMLGKGLNERSIAK